MKAIKVTLNLVTLSKVPLSLYRVYVNGWDRERYAEQFKSFTAGKSKYRLYIPIGGDQEGKAIYSAVVPTEILEYVENLGFRIKNYKIGTAETKTGKDISLAKILGRKPELLKIFNKDTQRRGASAAEAWVVISRHPYDVMGMSFNRGWDSCMNISTGINRHYVSKDIALGSLVAYLVDNSKKGLNIEKPIARILIKPSADNFNNIVLIPEEREYGKASSAFKQIVLKFCKKMNNSSPSGHYKANKELYDDSFNGRQEQKTSFHLNNSDTLQKLNHNDVADSPITNSKHFEELIYLRSNEVNIRIANNRACDPDSLAILINSNPSEEVCLLVARNTNTDADTLEQIRQKYPLNVKFLSGILGNEMASTESLDTIYKSCEKLSPSVRISLCCLLAIHRNISNKVLEELSVEPEVQAYVAINRFTPITILDNLSRSTDYITRLTVALNKKSPVKIVEKIISEDSGIESSYAQDGSNKDVLLDILIRSIKNSLDSDPEVNWKGNNRSFILSNEELPASCIDILLEHPLLPYEKGAIIACKNITPTQLDFFATDTNNLVKLSVASNKKCLKKTILELAKGNEEINCRLAQNISDRDILRDIKNRFPKSLKISNAISENPFSPKDIVVKDDFDYSDYFI